MGWKKKQHKRLLYSAHFCHYCGCRLSEDNRTLDHIVPRALGGTSALLNLVPCCLNDNGTKADSLPSCDCAQCIRAVVHYLGYTVARSWAATHPLDLTKSLLL